MGRPSKLTPEVQKEICGHISRGLTYQDAARLSGVGRSTFMKWKADGETQESGPCRDLLDAVKDADSEFKKTHLNVIIKAATTPSIVTKKHVVKKGGKVVLEEITEEIRDSTWQASGWLLERKFPEEFGKRIEHAGKIDGPAPVYQLLPAKAEGENDAKDENTD